MMHFRPMVDADLPLIMNSWLRSTFEDMKMTKEAFYSVYRDHINEVLSNSEVLVTCSPDDHNFIHAYMVYQKVKDPDVFLLHWVYVKAPFRRLGVMKRLIRQEFPELGKEQLVITYKNDKRERMFKSLNMVYRPDFRSVKL